MTYCRVSLHSNKQHKQTLYTLHVCRNSVIGTLNIPRARRQENHDPIRGRSLRNFLLSKAATPATEGSLPGEEAPGLRSRPHISMTWRG
jgi:hypothetical protein